MGEITGAPMGMFISKGAVEISSGATHTWAQYASGVMCAISDKALSSAVGFRGICRKELILLLVGVAHIVDAHVVGTGEALRTAVVRFYLSNEVNEGEAPQYCVENSHPAIVTAEVFDLVQYEIKRRRESGRHTSAAGIFSNRLVCGGMRRILRKQGLA